MSGSTCQHARTIRDLDTGEWDRLFGGTVCFTSSGLATLEDVFRDNERPEDRWGFYYYVIRDQSGVPVLATFFTDALWKDDMMAPASVSDQIETKRLEDPYYQTTRVLAMGTLLSEGDHLYLDRSRDWQAALTRLLCELECVRAECDAGMLVLRDLPPDDPELDDYASRAGFSRMEIAEAMNTEITWASREEWLAGLSYRARTFQRRQVMPFDSLYQVELLGQGHRLPSDEEIEHLWRLYLSVHSRALVLNTFPLPTHFLPAVLENPAWELLALTLKPQFGGLQGSSPHAFVAAFKGPEQYVPRVIGLDYELVRSHGLYRQCSNQILRRAETLGCKRVLCGIGAAYEKSRFGAERDPRALYIRAGSSSLSGMLRSASGSP